MLGKIINRMSLLQLFLFFLTIFPTVSVGCGSIDMNFAANLLTNSKLFGHPAIISIFADMDEGFLQNLIASRLVYTMRLFPPSLENQDNDKFGQQKVLLVGESLVINQTRDHSYLSLNASNINTNNLPIQSLVFSLGSDCILREHYKIHFNSHQILKENVSLKTVNRSIGEYTVEGGFTLGEHFHPHQWIRRRNLEGLTMRLAVVDHWPYFSKANSTGRYTGFFGEVVSAMVEHFNLTVEEIFPNTTSYGMKQENGSFDGYVKMLMDDEIDLVAIDMSITSERWDVIAYSLPLYEYKANFIIKRPTSALDWTVYLQVSTIELWLTLILFVVIFLVMDKLIDGSDLREGLKFVFCSLANRELEHKNRKRSSKIFAFTVLVFGFIIFSSFSALIVSKLSVKKFSIPFKDITEFIDSSYGVMMYNGSTMEMLRTSSPGSAERRLYDKKIVSGFGGGYSYDWDLGFSQRALDLLDKEYAIMVDANTVDMMKGYPCKFVKSPFNIWRNFMALTMQKDSEILPMINEFLLTIIESGQLAKIDSKIRQSNRMKTPGSINCEEYDVIELGLNNMIFLFLILVIGILTSLLIGAKEYFMRET